MAIVKMLRTSTTCGFVSVMFIQSNAWTFVDEDVLNGPDDCDGCDGWKTKLDCIF